MPVAAWILFAISAAGLLLLAVFVGCIAILRRRKVEPTSELPPVSILKPLAGLDDELERNLESHLGIDYPAPFELVLGVRSAQDPAYEFASAFAAKHSDRVRLVLQQGEPGHNPKVNQLLTLTREAKYDVLWCTDSNVRVEPHTLREAMAVLARPRVGLVSHMFSGVGEKRLGAVLDNLTLTFFCTTGVVGAQILLRHPQLVGKSVLIPKAVLKQIGGWAMVQDVLAEDQRLGRALQKAGLEFDLCPTPVHNVQIHQRVRQFWMRQSRWQMIRYRVVPPAAVAEPFLNPFVNALLAALIAWNSPLAWGLCAAVSIGTMAIVQAAAVLTRGHGFKLRHLVLMPVRDLLFLGIWIYGATLRSVDWRGNRLLVLRKTRLAAEEAMVRIRNMRLGR